MTGWRPWRRWVGRSASERRTAHRYIDSLVQLGRIERDGKYAVGKDGWLFLAEDSNDSFAQHAGTRTLSSGELAAWTALIERRAERLAARGCPYVLLIAPDTHSVYPEHLPEGTPHAPERPVHQIINSLDGRGSDAAIVYPLAEMAAAKEAGVPVGSPIDSHWTDLGAFTAYAALLDRLDGIVATRRLTRSDYLFLDIVSAGDLGSKLTPPRLASHPSALVRYQHARLVCDNCIDSSGSLIITDCGVAPPTTCLVLGDSYSYHLMKFFSESFGRVVQAHSSELDWQLVEQFEPDVVVNVVAERFLVQVPDDATANFAALEREKRASRSTRPPSLLWFRPHRLPSPAEVEVLRAHFLSEGNVRDATITSVFAYGGMVQREVAALRWPDLNGSELIVRRRHQRVGHGSPARRIPLIGPLAEDLEEWRRLSDPSRPRQLVFPSERGRQWGAPEWNAWERDVFEPAVEACGLEVLASIEDLRSTFCTLTLYEGLPTRVLARRVGMRHREAIHRYGWLANLIGSQDPVDPAALVRSARGTLAVATL